MKNSTSVFLPHVWARRFFNINFGFFYNHSLESPCFKRFNAVSHDLPAHLQAEISGFEVWVESGQNWVILLDKLGLLECYHGKVFTKIHF